MRRTYWLVGPVYAVSQMQGEEHMKTEFNEWWNEDLLTEDNPHVDGTPAYWAWEGWCAGVKAEREACAKVCEERLGPTATDFYGKTYAAAIRNRSNT
jgi:hypothetical protein